LFLFFKPATLILPGYFQKYLSTAAIGICVVGSGLGGLVLSLLVNSVIETNGNQKWALSMIGFATVVTSLIPATIMRPRITTKSLIEQTMTTKNVVDNFKIIFNLKVFNSDPLILDHFGHLSLLWGMQ
jgi:hypothetical protein